MAEAVTNVAEKHRESIKAKAIPRGRHSEKQTWHPDGAGGPTEDGRRSCRGREG